MRGIERVWRFGLGERTRGQGEGRQGEGGQGEGRRDFELKTKGQGEGGQGEGRRDFETKDKGTRRGKTRRGAMMRMGDWARKDRMIKDLARGDKATSSFECVMGS